MAIKLTDERHSRGRGHRELLVIPAADLIVEFTGKSIAGVARLDAEDYHKNGKWSHSTWTVTLAAGVEHARLVQDFETGAYLNAQHWDAAIAEFRQSVKPASGLTDAAITRFIRAALPKIASRLDEAGDVLAQAPDFAALVAAQEEAAAAASDLHAAKAEVEQCLETSRLQEKAAADRAAAAEARAKLAQMKGKKLSLTELQAALS